MNRDTTILQRVLWMACVLGALLGGTASFAAGPAAAEQVQRQQSQPLNNAPVWREVRSGEQHVTNIKGVDTGVLIQSGGQTWRMLRNGPITLYGGIALCAMVVLLAAFFKLRGPIMLSGEKTGRLIERFST
ncbi:MAG TPA: formate dehydrogenase subunit gamma, partial [Methyloversatilis sp.]